MFGLPVEMELEEKPAHISMVDWAAIVAQKAAFHQAYEEDFFEETFQCMSTLASIVGGASFKLQSLALGPMFFTNFKSEILALFFDNESKMLDSIETLEIDSFRFNDLECYFVDNLDEFASGSIYIRDQGDVYGVWGDPEFDARVATKDLEDWTFLRLLLDRNVGGLRSHVKTLKLSMRVGFELESFETLEIVAAVYKKENHTMAITSVFEKLGCSAALFETAVDDYESSAAPWPLTIALLGTGSCEELRYIVESKVDWARVFCKFEELQKVYSFDEELIAAITHVTPPQLSEIVCCSRSVLKQLVKSIERPIHDYFPVLLQPVPFPLMLLDDEVEASLPTFSSPTPLRFVFELHCGGVRQKKNPGMGYYVIHELMRSRIDLSRRNPRNALDLLNKYFS